MKLHLMAILCILSSLVQAFPCQEIVFDYKCSDHITVVDAEVLVNWRYNPQCKDFDKRRGEFSVQVSDIFDNILIRDTVETFSYQFSPSDLHASANLLIFEVQEVGRPERYSLVFELKTDQQIPEEEIEKLNFFLLNGYLFNARAMLQRAKRKDLLSEIAQHYATLFPPNYAGDCSFFNIYLSASFDQLVTMPYVTGLYTFVRNLNKHTKEDFIKGDSFFIQLSIST
ncbi:MAG: hypothetical protein AAFO69_19200, partial [Bacteroidota bacterium]